ncbi:MAG TPA: hypothetical protein VJP76_03235, partial [Candidatus Tumulicola sp.]|nr:hypothetical protein [Candidatus Tumulicola sp.]
LSVVTIGASANLEYLVSVLPAHALSEAARDTQFSLTSVLAALGANPATAIRAGSLWYLAMLFLGCATAARLSKESGNPAFLVCVPPAFAVFGGTFVHVTQIAVALPAAILFLAPGVTQRRAPASIAIMLLSVPWVMAWSPALGLAPAFPIAYLAWRYWGGTLAAILASALVAAGLLVILNQALAVSATHAGSSPPIPAIDPKLAEASWATFTSKSSNGELGAWLVRLPTWGGLLLLLGVATSAANVLRMKALPRSVAS